MPGPIQFPERFIIGRVPGGTAQAVLTNPNKNRSAYRKVLWFSICNPTVGEGQVTVRLSRPKRPSVILTTVDLVREQTFYWKDLPFLLGPDVTSLIIQPLDFLAHYAVSYRDVPPVVSD